MSGVKRAQDGRVVRCAEGASDLGVHVEGVLVARMVESAVATRLRVHESRAGGSDAENGRSTFDSECLCRDTHVRIAVSHEHGIEVVPVWSRLAARYVHPLDYHGAVELRRRGRTA